MPPISRTCDSECARPPARQQNAAAEVAIRLMGMGGADGGVVAACHKAPVVYDKPAIGESLQRVLFAKRNSRDMEDRGSEDHFCGADPGGRRRPSGRPISRLWRQADQGVGCGNMGAPRGPPHPEIIARILAIRLISALEIFARIARWIAQ